MLVTDLFRSRWLRGHRRPDAQAAVMITRDPVNGELIVRLSARDWSYACGVFEKAKEGEGVSLHLANATTIHIETHPNDRKENHDGLHP
jgi:hypothetical protein